LFLERLGITIDDLNQVLEKSKKYGSISKVLQALDDFPTLETIQQQISTMCSQKEDLRNHTESLKKEIKTLEDQRSQIKDILDLYNELKQLGLNESVLHRIKEVSNKYGRMENILEAIQVYNNLTEIRAHADEFENKISNSKTKLDKINADYAHFQTLIDMCHTLLYDYKFSISAINEIYGMAKRYGKPFEVIKAVAKYGELQDLENIVNELSKQRSDLESRIKILENRTHELEGQAETIKESVNGLLQPVSSELKQTISSTMESLTSTYKQQIDIIRKDTEEYAKRLGQSAVFEEELKLARLVRTMIKYPTDIAANNLPIDYAILLIGAVSNFCRAKKINPKAKAGEDINKKYSNMLSFLEVEVLDLLDWTKRVLEGSM
jgi:chromosome segregation ATPase